MKSSNTYIDKLRQQATLLTRLFHTHSLQLNMTISYVWLTVVSVLFLEICGMIINSMNIWRLGGLLFRDGIVLLVITSAIGGLFGFLTTRPLVRRIRCLVTATTLFTDGNYAQHVRVMRSDEIGQLEQHFNRMAEQLVEGITTRQELAEQNARMAERARLSRELHDAISQDLFSLRTLADGLQMAIQSGVQAIDLKPHIAILKQTTINMTHEMRALLLEMRPPQLDGLSFSSALEELASHYTARLGITIRTTLASPLSLRPEVEDALLRISQEAIHNAARHSSATEITLDLLQKDDAIILKIEDNGLGFREDEISQKHGLGLRMMQERVRDLQGQFHLNSVPGQGTWVQVYLNREQAT